MTRNASVFDREFNIGDLVTFRRDNQRGGTSWSPTCRVIGHENQKNIWLLCGNVPVLVASHNIRIASPSEALAQSVLNREPVIPYKIINDTGQQAFLDARQADEVEVVREGPGQADDVEVVHEDSAIPPYQKYLKMNGTYGPVSLKKMRRRKTQVLWKKTSFHRVELQKEELKDHVQEMKIMNAT